MKTLNEWVTEVHELAKSKGWYDGTTERSPLEMHMLIVSEIAEATEEARKREMPPIYQFPMEHGGGPLTIPGDKWVAYEKPEGELVELADAVIRIFDYCGARGWDLEQAIRLKHAYNQTRPHRHGGKRY
jgi:NTP pyrophosphatase (non-canonical NTP hydrolase)